MFSSIWGVKPELNLPVGKKLLQGSIAGGTLKMCLSQADHVKVLEGLGWTPEEYESGAQNEAGIKIVKKSHAMGGTFEV